LHEALEIARELGRDGVWETLGENAEVIARLEKGQKLWTIIVGLMEAESWWGKSGADRNPTRYHQTPRANPGFSE
jgi:hypothetical protein